MLRCFLLGHLDHIAATSHFYGPGVNTVTYTHKCFRCHRLRDETRTLPARVQATRKPVAGPGMAQAAGEVVHAGS